MRKTVILAVLLLLQSPCFAKSNKTEFTTKKAPGTKVVRECTAGKKKMDVKLTLMRKGKKDTPLVSFTSPSPTCDLDVTWNPNGKYFAYGYSVKKEWDGMRADESTLVLFDLGKNQELTLEKDYKGEFSWGPQIGTFVEEKLKQKSEIHSYKFVPSRVVFSQKNLIYYRIKSSRDRDCSVIREAEKITSDLSGNITSTSLLFLKQYSIVNGRYRCEDG